MGNKIYRIISIVLSIVLAFATGYALFQVMSLQVLPTKIFIPVCIAIVAFILILIVLVLKSSKIWQKIITMLLVVVCGFVMVVGNLYLAQTSNFFESVTGITGGEVKNTVSVITLADSDIEDVDDLDGATIGTLKSINTDGTKKSTTDLHLNDIEFTTKKYKSVEKQVSALYSGKVDAIILNETYRATVQDIEEYADFNNETKVVHETSYYTTLDNAATAVSDITEKPFTILISGNDTYGDVSELSRSDVNLLVTVNPTTNEVLMTSIPRDYYVELTCSSGACAEGEMDKLTHTGVNGIDVTKETIENLLDIDINYTFRVNFSSMIDIVDALGGIDIYVEEGMAVEKFYADSTLEGVTEGKNHLDGERALAYARERHAYTDGDIQRARNQQQVLEAIIDKATSSSVLTNYTELLNAMSGAFQTNMSMTEITALIQYQLNESPEWNFDNFVLDGTADELVCASVGGTASVLVANDAYVQAAHDKIEAVLDGKKASSVEVDLSNENTYGNTMGTGTTGEDPLESAEAEAAASSDTTTYYDDSSVYYDQSQYYYDTSQYATTDDSYYYGY